VYGQDNLIRGADNADSSIPMGVTGQLSMKTCRIFVSYCHSDVDFARLMARDWLGESSTFGLMKFTILAGNSLWREINKGPEQSDRIVPVLSRASVIRPVDMPR